MLLTNQLTNQKTIWLIRLTSFFWLASKIICYKLWLSDRLYPLSPPADFLQAPSLVHGALFVASIAALLGLLIFSNNKKLLVFIIVIEIASCLFDQNRWQPWEYQFILTFLIILFNRKNEKDIMSFVGFMFAAIYFYSGVGKMNPVFLHSIWYNLILSKTFGVSQTLAYQPNVYYAGYLLGLSEIILGLGLLFKNYQRKAAILLIVMHVIILGIFGPVGLNYDHVIWPWNLLMMASLIVLVLKNKEFKVSILPIKFNRNILFIVLLGIMPVFSLFNRWDHFLSFSLFSARPADMYICIKKTEQNFLMKYSDKSKPPCDTGSYFISLRNWAFDDMMTPGYPEPRVYKNIKMQLQKRYPNLQATYFIYTYQNGKKVKEELR